MTPKELLSQNQQGHMLQQIIRSRIGVKGTHIIYMFNEQDKYLRNVVNFVSEGLDNGDWVFLAEPLNNYLAIMEGLRANGYSEESLGSISHLSSMELYLSEKGFDAEANFEKLEKMINSRLENGISVRTWGQVFADQSSITEIIKYESMCDELINKKNVTSVCTYNALTTPAFFQNELLKVHEYMLVDDVMVKSAFYDKQYEPFSQAEMERVQLLEKEINNLKEKNEKLLLDKARQKQREKFLKDEKINAERANRAKSVFLSQMSHDLRTPLNTIQGYAQILLLRGLNKEHHEKISKMYHASEQLLQLIEELLDFTAIDIGNITINTEVISLVPFLKECVDSLLETKETNVDIQLEALKEDIYIEADPLRLSQIIMNLLDNAIKYNTPNGKVIMYFTFDEEDGTVTINVKDNGQGISEMDKQLIFDPFYRSKIHMKNWKGSGLGLAIVAQLTTKMNGTYGVRSSEGKGSTFWVSFKKINKVKQQNTIQIDNKWSPNDQTFDVFYIEDNQDNIDVIRELLSAVGNIQLRYATTGSSGLEQINLLPPDVILLDLTLIDCDGLDVLYKLKANPLTQNIPIIVVSADALETTKKEALKLGAFAYLTKPIRLEELRKLFTKTIEEMI